MTGLGGVDILAGEARVVVSPILNSGLSLIGSNLVIPVLEVILGCSSVGGTVLAHHGTEATLVLVGLTVKNGREGITTSLVVRDELRTRHSERIGGSDVEFIGTAAEFQGSLSQDEDGGKEVEKVKERRKQILNSNIFGKLLIKYPSS